MEIIQYSNPSELLEDTLGFLMQHEVENSLQIGLLKQAAKEVDHSNYFYSAIKDTRGAVVFVGMMYGKYMILSHSDNEYKEICNMMIDYFKDNDIAFPGIIGTRPMADYFNESYNRKYSPKMALHMDQRIYKLTSVEDISISEGEMVIADESYFELIRDWINGFAKDTGEVIIGSSGDEKATLYIGNRDVFLWIKDGKPVAMCKKGRKTASGITVTLVYTPKSNRGNGYGSSLVAQASRMLLKDSDYCTLYTDLSNPTSNGIYMKIGYKPVCDSVVFEIEGQLR